MSLLTVFLIAVAPAPALAYDCPRDMSTDQQSLRAWLAPWTGSHEMANCKVEITACSTAGADEFSSVVGEVFVTTADGREAYLPLTLADSTQIETRASLHGRSLWYLKRDKYYETEMGRTETARLEIRIGPEAITSLDLGMYATNKRRPGSSPSRWYNCGLGAE